MIYIFSRVRLEGLGYDPGNPLLSAHRISLKVLAPPEAYRQGSLEKLETALNAGLHHLVSRLPVAGIQMDFCFEQFPAGEVWPPGEVMRRRERVYPIEGKRT